VGELVTIRTFLNRPSAEGARMALEAAGIDTLISADDAGGTRPELAVLKGVSILVKEEDAHRAFKILEESEKEGVKQRKADQGWFKEERSKALVRNAKSARFAAIVAVTSFLLGLWLIFGVGEIAFAIVSFFILFSASGVLLTAILSQKELSRKSEGE